MRLHHVNIVVRPGETDRITGFYTDVLGLRRTEKPAEGTSPGGAWFDIDEVHQLHVSERAADGTVDEQAGDEHGADRRGTKDDRTAALHGDILTACSSSRVSGL